MHSKGMFTECGINLFKYDSKSVITYCFDAIGMCLNSFTEINWNLRLTLISSNKYVTMLRCVKQIMGFHAYII